MALVVVGTVIETEGQGRRWRPWLGGHGRGGESHRDAKPTSVPGREGEGSVVCLSNALDDGQAQADTSLVRVGAFGAPPKRLGERGDQLRGEFLARALD